MKKNNLKKLKLDKFRISKLGETSRLKIIGGTIQVNTVDNCANTIAPSQTIESLYPYCNNTKTGSDLLTINLCESITI